MIECTNYVRQKIKQEDEYYQAHPQRQNYLRSRTKARTMIYNLHDTSNERALMDEQKT